VLKFIQNMSYVDIAVKFISV